MELIDKQQDKYFYIAVPREQFHEVKHIFYEAPSSYLKVFEGDVVADLREEIAKLKEDKNGLWETIEQYREMHERRRLIHADMEARAIQAEQEWAEALSLLRQKEENESLNKRYLEEFEKTHD